MKSVFYLIILIISNFVSAQSNYILALSKGEKADSRSIIFFTRAYVGKIKLDGVKPVDDQYYGVSIGLKG